MNFMGMKEYIDAALLRESSSAASIFSNPKNTRGYNCCVINCSREAYSKGMCNAHYIRNKKGKVLDLPIRARKREDECVSCGKKTGAKGGWGMCSSHYKKKRYEVIKDACIDYLGGKCNGCGLNFHRCVFDFHHINDKNENPSSIIINKSSLEIAKEISNCILLCANCHRIKHYG